jgi:hypothetical protein
MIERRDTCKRCKFYQPEILTTGYDTFRNADSGDCRKAPPTVLEEGQRWPSVRKTDWCGAFSAASTRSIAISEHTGRVKIKLDKAP